MEVAMNIPKPLSHEELKKLRKPVNVEHKEARARVEMRCYNHYRD